MEIDGVSAQNESIMENIFTQYDIEEAIDQCNFERPLGPDWFDGRIIKQESEIRNRIADEITETLNNGHIP